MLSRTASSLFWMGRYMERAENLARLLDVSQQHALMPGASPDVIAMPLEAIDQRELFETTKKPITADEIAYFLMLHEDSPSSIMSSLRQARANAHVVRGTITSELWESLNATWLEMRLMTRAKIRSQGQTRFLEWVKERSHVYRGILIGTSQRNDAYLFARLGTDLERADNTTRLFRYHLEAFAAPNQTGRPSYYAWAALLRALSAYEAYRDIYSDSLRVDRIGEMLLMREDLPRSLLACFSDIAQTLAGINGEHSREVRRRVALIQAQLRYGRWDVDFAEDAVAKLDDLLVQISDIGEAIEQAYWAADDASEAALSDSASDDALASSGVENRASQTQSMT